MWTLANTAHKLKRRGRTAEVPTFWLLTDAERIPDPVAHVAKLPRGSAVILRHYGNAQRTALAAQLAHVCRTRGLILLVAGDWRLAAAVRADGLHLPEYMARIGLPPGARLWRRAGQRLLTVAAHSTRGLQQAQRLNASTALLAPVFPTLSHPNDATLGARRFGVLTRAAHVPVIALGGINEKTIAALMSSGCVGIAGVGFAG